MTTLGDRQTWPSGGHRGVAKLAEAVVHGTLSQVQTADVGIVNAPPDYQRRSVTVRVAGSVETVFGRNGDEKTPQMVLGGVPWMDSPFVRGPLSSESSGIIVYAGRSIDPYIVNGDDKAEPSDPRRHDPNDAILIPAVLRGAGEDTDVIVSFPPGSAGLARLVLQPDGGCDLGNGTENVVGLLWEALGVLNTLATSLSGAANIGAVNIAGATAQAALSGVGGLLTRVATIKP